MTDPLVDFARQHFEQGSRTSLLRAMTGCLSRERLLSCFRTRNRSLHQFAVQQWRQTFSVPDRQEIAAALREAPGDFLPLIAACRQLPTDAASPLAGTLRELLTHAQPQVREAAALTWVHLFPEQIEPLLPLLETAVGKPLARLLGWSGNSALVEPLLKCCGTVTALPPTAGFLLTPQFLADRLDWEWETTLELLGRFGYLEEEPFPGMSRWLSRGWMTVFPELESLSEKAAADRLSRFRWALLPDALQLAQELRWNIDDPLDQGIFLAAVRESDRQNLALHQQESPFAPPGRQRQAAVCFHAPLRYARQLFLDEPLRLAAELEVPANVRDVLVLDWARVQLETEPQARLEAELILRCRWQAMRQSRCWQPRETQPLVWPVTNYADFPTATRAVLPVLVPCTPPAGLSPGAESVVRLAAHCGRDAELLAQQLLEAEQRWGDLLPPLGLELQIPAMSKNESLGWKQTLRALGIPSPRRPEYGAMVEAAFRPAFSFHAFLPVPGLLGDLGLIHEPQEIAVHISIQGDLGETARWLAFPQLFIHPPKAKESRTARNLLPLMSKGLVHWNSDIEQCHPRHTVPGRTELRLFCCPVERVQDRLTVPPAWVNDLVCTHLLAAALLSEHPPLQDIARDYCRQIELYVSQLPACFGDLLRANFYECTGESQDADLIPLLPIVQQRNAARDWLRENPIQDRLERELLQIVRNSSREVYQSLCREAGDLEDFPHGLFGVG